MAYTIVSPIVNNLSLLLLSEASFLRGVETQVKSLRIELEHMKEFLKDPDGIQDQPNKAVVVNQIRDIACEAEDIVDKYVLDIAKEKRRNRVMKLLRSFNKAAMLHNVGEQIQQLQTISKEIKDNRDRYIKKQNDVNVDEDELQRLQRLQRRRTEVEEDEVIGFDEEAVELVNKLVKGTKELDVISISGMGGLGKTTLAKKIYKHPLVKDGFTCRAWVSVSQKLKLKKLLMEILKEVTKITEEIAKRKMEELKQEPKITKEIEKMEEEELKQELKKQLSNHRYLVVLDDIWSCQDWDALENVFPNKKNRSRVFVTTRIKEVASYASRISRNPPLELRFLNAEESWELFTRKVFQQEPCPTNLEPHGKEIVAKCGGLPLAIVVLGGLLANKKNHGHEWELMIKGVQWHLEMKTICFDVLGLSYSHLSPELRPCFLYLGLFPEDFEIPTRQLIQLWISEGFIQHVNDDKLKKEDVAEKYLQDLIDRSLIQVEKRRSDGGVKTCRVHDLTRDLCLKLSNDEKFLESSSCVPSEVTKPRRLSIHYSCRDNILYASRSNICCTRTLLCFNQDHQVLSDEEGISLFKWKLLRVLDLGDKEVQRVPKAIGKLSLLKYLRVKATNIDCIPSSICGLSSLQTLDLSLSQINHLPKEIWTMQQLRHLFLGGHSSLPKNTGNKCLCSLQTLCYISPTEPVDIKENAPNLRKLGLYGSSNKGNSTFNLPHLECLKLDTFNDDELIFGEGLFPKLQSLKIKNSNIRRWNLGQGAVPKLKHVVIKGCPNLNTDTIGSFNRSGVEVVIKPTAQ